GSAMTTFTGQNIGAQKMDLVIKGSKQGTLIAVAVSASITAVLLVFGHYLMNVFT
ncbi:MAG TPA: MATE family efflux transporter, partial [Firmicutes bacterium]|nr:MATE family efflux transporter [Bacillota bacterium]